MAPGEVVSVTVYYHNTGNQIAPDTRLRIAPQNNPAVNQKIFVGGVWATGVSPVMGNAIVSIPGTPQTITYIPGSAALFPEHTTSPQYLNTAQEAALFSAAGLSIGNILPDSTCPITQTFCHQGSVVARFQIGNTVIPPTVYQCSDGNDNDHDGRTDYPSDPGCFGPTDNDEYNAPPTVYQCSDQQDNDNDGFTDYPSDPGCFGPTDNDEYNVVQPQAYVTAGTQPATNVVQTSATLNGTFATNQSQTTVWFEWGTTQSLGNQTSQQQMFGSSGNFTAFISSLSPNTTYHFRACADTTATSQSCGSILSFLTGTQQINAPSVVTTSGNCFPSQNAFTASGSFSSNGSSSTTTWFQYGTNINSLGNQVGNQTQFNSSGNFSSVISGLFPNTTYYFQAVAQNQGGTAYGTILNCTTLGQILPPPPPPPPTPGTPPVVTTVPASNVAQTSARLNGFLNSIGNPGICSNCLSTFAGTQTDVWYEWGPTPALGYSTNRQVISTPTTFNYFLTGFRANTTYYFRAIAQNAHGFSQGAILSFTTAPTGQGPEIIYVNTHTGGKGPVVMINIKSDYESVCLGDTVRYTATYQNLTTKTLKDVIVQVIIPKEETFLRASRGSYSVTANTLTINVGDLRGKEKGTFEIESKINGRTKSSDTLVTTATLVYTTQAGAQGDAIGYAMVNVTCGSSFSWDGHWCWILLGILLLLMIILLARRSRRYYS